MQIFGAPSFIPMVDRDVLAKFFLGGNLIVWNCCLNHFSIIVMYKFYNVFKITLIWYTLVQ